VSDFTRELLNHLPANRETHEEIPATATTASTTTSSSTDVELLQALTHEVRTPLTTIRMLTRLLLKRKDLGNDVLKRLRAIDQECTEQINRMELIFQATELEGKNESKQEVNVSPIPLQELFAQSIPYWKKQAKRRNVELDVIVPEQLPTVITNPELLTQVLTGLMENFTSRLPTGGKIKVQVKSAGHQIKLQLLSQSSSANTVNPVSSYRNRGKSIGQLLTLQPETGNLSLNLSVTKNLFEAIGGKLTVRQRPEVGEELTVFLPANLIR
jgi:signal transduction histidine kinase